MKNNLSYNYIDTLRVLACFSVILLHYSGSYTYRFGIPTFDVGTQFFTITRWCVPVFLMISGALLLGKSQEVISFYKRRFLRILPPFLFWSFIYIAFKIYSQKIEVHEIFSLIMVKGAEFHFWYVYLILGIILFLPFLTDWTSKKNLKSLVIFLIIWLYWLIITNQYNEYSVGINLIYFSGYIGYVILGYYLHLIKPKTYHWVLGLVFFLIGFFYSYYSAIQASYELEKWTEITQKYLSWNVLLMSIGVFLMAKQIKLPAFSHPLMKEISKYSFGIYLAHIFVRDTLVINYFDFLKVDNYSFLLIKSILVLAFSYIIVKLINKIPVFGKYISG